MILSLDAALLRRIERHGEERYPEEGAGLVLGKEKDGERVGVDILPIENTFAEEARSHRYLIDPEAMMEAEQEAEERGLSLIGVFHSHPDHPPYPSAYDRKMALPWFIYLISSVGEGKAGESRAWRLLDDRDEFEEITLQLESNEEAV